ncbi:hypothetical protein L1887_35492 [Cichorium endivia]|nr:hypothetical protein L1887_35492 [Cichorium endivia]
MSNEGGSTGADVRFEDNNGTPTGVDGDLLNLEVRLRGLLDTNISLMRRSIQLVERKLPEMYIVFPRTLMAELRSVPMENIQLIVSKMYGDIEDFATTVGFITKACRQPANTHEGREVIDTTLDTIRQYIALFESHKAIARLHVFQVHSVPLPD